MSIDNEYLYNPAHRILKNFLGEDLLAEYRGIYPLLALCYYRERTYRNLRTLDNFFAGESYSFKSGLLKAVWAPFLLLKSFLSPKNKKSVLLSHTIINSNRYVSLRYKISDYAPAVKLCSFANIPVFPWEKKASPVRDIYVPVNAICDQKIKDLLKGWIDFSIEMKDSGKTSADNIAETRRYLSRLEKRYSKKVSQLKKHISKLNINQYITINQYNFIDLAIIDACRQLGIKTKQFEHHASRFMLNIKEHERTERQVYAQTICCWTESEVLAHKNVYRYECPFGDDAPEIIAVGNPEIDYQDAVQAMEKYPPQDRITIMMSGLMFKGDLPRLEKQLNFRKNFFEKIHALSEKAGVSVIVRYPPGLDMEFREEEERIINGYGFEISPSTRDSMFRDILGSKWVFGTVSSALGLSRLLGRQVYQMKDWDEDYYIKDKNIRIVSIDEIEDIDLFAVQEPRLNKEDFFDCGKLLAID